MVAKKTIITELSTALGIIAPNREEQLLTSSTPPTNLKGVKPSQWSKLTEYWQTKAESKLFQRSFMHGRYFSNYLRKSQVVTNAEISWAGPKRTTPDSPPADLIIDIIGSKIYISCKNDSKVNRNPSPMSLFKTALRNSPVHRRNWYSEIAPREYSCLLQAATSHLGLKDFPDDPDELTKCQGETLKSLMKRKWPKAIEDSVSKFVEAVSEKSASSLNGVIQAPEEKLDFGLRLLRIIDIEYFILGTQKNEDVRVRVMTRSEFNKKFSITGLSVTSAHKGQPQVDWEIHVASRSSGKLPPVLSHVKGHFEIRWSHGKFNGAPESKVYLETPHPSVPGYERI